MFDMQDLRVYMVGWFFILMFHADRLFIQMEACSDNSTGIYFNTFSPATTQGLREVRVPYCAVITRVCFLIDFLRDCMVLMTM